MTKKLTPSQLKAKLRHEEAIKNAYAVGLSEGKRLGADEARAQIRNTNWFMNDTVRRNTLEALTKIGNQISSLGQTADAISHALIDSGLSR